MRRRLKSGCKKLLVVWMLWSALFISYETLRMQIPESLYLYEDEAVTVLSGYQKKVSPRKLNLDFSGEIDIVQSGEGNYKAVCKLFGVIPLKKMELEVVSRQNLIPGGIPVGIYIQTDGVFVIGTGPIETSRGTLESPLKNIVKTGDYIIYMNGKKISQKQELVDGLKQSTEKEIVLGIRRNEEELQVAVRPVETEQGRSLGIWVRDDTQGVGTLTFVTEEQGFGALGHGISDSDSELLMEISDGKLYDCEITGIVKGKKGKPGKLSGKINYNSKNIYGQITGNLKGGVYGTVNENLLDELNQNPLPIALKQEIREGEATILSSVSGTLESYAVEIRKVHRGESEVNKGMELVVTDERLLALTGGIVQGMSGSPIIQEGKLVGAVTHVLVNDPTRGYGIFVENMLAASE